MKKFALLALFLFTSVAALFLFASCTPKPIDAELDGPVFYATPIPPYVHEGDFAFTPLSLEAYAVVAFRPSEYPSRIEIPSSFDGKPVTAIDRNGFKGLSMLKEVVIPSSVTVIGDGAFSGCSGLLSIEIPSGVTSIGRGAFSGCVVLPSIELPESVTSIGEYAFHNCTALTSVEIPESVTSIGDCAFYNCTALSSIKLPNMGIEKEKFSYSENIVAGCDSLTMIESDWLTIYAFADLFRLASKTFVGLLKMKASMEDLRFSFGEYPSDFSVELRLYPFSELRSIQIPRDEYLYGIWVVASEETTFVTIPDGVVSVGIDVSACREIASVTFPASVKRIDDFQRKTNDLSFYYRGTLSDWCEIEGLYWVEKLKTVYIDGKKREGRVEIPADVEKIGSWAFSDCTEITEIVFPNSVKIIGKQAFEYCPGLTSLEIPSSVTEIGDYAFASCKGLTSVVLPNGVQTVGSGCFALCEELTSVTIPASVTKLGEELFSTCPKMHLLFYEGTIEAWNAIDKEHWDLYAEELTIRCTDGEIEDVWLTRPS